MRVACCGGGLPTFFGLRGDITSEHKRGETSVPAICRWVGFVVMRIRLLKGSIRFVIDDNNNVWLEEYTSLQLGKGAF